ncbi:MAG: phosphoglycerate kinase [Alphaproteobacteria bacterium]|nr:phosphoglycerate kinase [Alphaproteobacteria bacterium]
MATRFSSLDDVDVAGKTVLVRVDLNVPMQQGRISDRERITRIVPTLEVLIKRRARVVVMSHFGRPEGHVVLGMSLAPLVDALSEALGGKDVRFGVDCVGPAAQSAVAALKPGEVLLLENLRFHAEEKANDPIFGKALASLGDIYVNDAFSCSHRAHASIVGIAKHLPAVAGRLMQEELEALGTILDQPKKPIAAIIGGAKVSTNLALLSALVERMDMMVVGGGMANTFLYAQGHSVGASLCEPSLKKTALEILKKAEKHGCEILLPEDVVAARTLAASAPCEVMPVGKLPKDMMILDIGPRTAMHISGKLESCATVVWNGPLGAFEFSPFDTGTISLARMVASLTYQGKMKSIAGGGDTVSSLKHAGLAQSFTYMSTAGGAFLEWLEGKTLPGIASLENQKEKAA